MSTLMRRTDEGHRVAETEKRAKITAKTIYYNFVLLGVNIRWRRYAGRRCFYNIMLKYRFACREVRECIYEQ